MSIDESEFLFWLDEHNLKKFEGVFGETTFSTLENKMFVPSENKVHEMILVKAPVEKLFEYSIVDDNCM